MAYHECSWPPGDVKVMLQQERSTGDGRPGSLVLMLVFLFLWVSSPKSSGYRKVVRQFVKEK